MTEENPNDVRTGEAKPAEAETRERGLRILARMIARMYIRDIEPKNNIEPREWHASKPQETRPGKGRV